MRVDEVIIDTTRKIREIIRSVNELYDAPRTAAFAAADLPAASAEMDGRVVLDTTNNRLVFYANGSRYYASGTSF